MNVPDRHSRLLGGLWGALAGDALGVPVEFRSRTEVRRNPVTGMRGFGTHNQPPGTWSDDSSLLLCTVESLAKCDGLDPMDLGNRFVRWEEEGYWTPRGRVFDIGIATAQALSRIATGTPATEAGGVDEYSNGNGSLMRILPVACWFGTGSAEQMARQAEVASTLTHRHPRSQMACAFYCLFVRELLDGIPPGDAFLRTRETFASLYNEPPFFDERLHFQLLENRSLGVLPENEIGSSGYVMHTLAASIWALLTSRSFEETVLKAVNLGDDTDTTGTVAGGLAGVVYGMESIPQEWIDVLARRAEVESLFNCFIAAMQGIQS